MSKKEFRNNYHRAQFLSEHVYTCEGLLDVAVHEWLANGHSIRITADVPNVETLEDICLNSEDVAKAIFEYVLTHEAEVDKMTIQDIAHEPPIYNGRMFQKGDEVVWEMDVDKNE